MLAKVLVALLLSLVPSEGFASPRVPTTSQSLTVGRPGPHRNLPPSLSAKTLPLHGEGVRLNAAVVSGDSFTLPTFDKHARTSLVSAAAFAVLDIAFRRLFLMYNIGFPSSLAGCAFLFASLLSLPSEAASDLFDKLSPGALLLAKWLPLFFVPSLVTLPLADSMGSATELLKIGIVIVGGFYFTLLTTAGSVLGIRKVLGSSSTADNVPTIAEPARNNAIPKAFSDETMNGLILLTSISGAGALVSTFMGQAALAGPLTALFFLSTTFHTFVFGARLPKKVTKLIHPLVTCTSLTWAVSAVFASLTGRSFRSMLVSYRTGNLRPSTGGPGDLLLWLLGPAVVSLAVSMYERRQLMRENLPEVGTSVAVATAGGVFGTALLVRLLDIASPQLKLSLLSRNITSPLAMAIAGILGADVSLAVSFVVVTGLIGANFGASILDAVGIKDAVARGLGIGASAHGLGTAAFANEKDAFPFAAIAMALTASAATVTVSIPVLKRIILQLALGS